MIRLRCASCGYEVQVASLIAAASQPCAACGRTVIGGVPPIGRGGVAPVEHWRYDDEEPPPSARPPERSIWITLLGLYLIVTATPGLLLVLCCGGIVGPSLLFPGDFKEEFRKKNQGKAIAALAADDDLDRAEAGAKIAVAVALVFFGSLFGLQCLAGIGVLRRRQWGRFLTLGSTGMLCLGSFVVAFYGGNIVFIVVLFLAFAATAVVLLSERATAEFTHRNAWWP